MHASPVEYSTPLPPRNPVLREISVEEDTFRIFFYATYRTGRCFLFRILFYARSP